MDAITKVNWSTCDPQKIIGDYIEMPDGTQHYIEMELLHWYWLDFMFKNSGRTAAHIAQHALDVIQQSPDADFDSLFRIGVFEYGRHWVKLTEGR